MGIEDQQDANVTGVEDEGFDYSTFGVEPEQSQQPEQQQGQAEQIKDNPKWAPFLEVIPAPFHEPVKKHLKEWDQGVNQRFQEIQQEWAPFKRFREEQIDPERLQRSYELANRLANDPTGFYNDLHASLVARGLLQEQQQQQQEQQQQQDPDDPEANDPYAQRIAALERQEQERMQAFAQFVEQQEQERLMEDAKNAELAAIDKDFNSIETRIGQPLSDPLKRQIIEKAMIMGQQQQRPVTIIEAANEVFRFLSAARSGRKVAPGVIPTAGGMPHTPVGDPAEMNEQQRREAAFAIRQRFLEQ